MNSNTESSPFRTNSGVAPFGAISAADDIVGMKNTVPSGQSSARISFWLRKKSRLVSSVGSLFITTAAALLANPAPVQAEAPSPQSDAIRDSLYATLAPVLKSSDWRITPDARAAYLNWAENIAMGELRNSHQSVPYDCLSEVWADSTLSDAMFAAVFPPDPSILQNYARLRTEMGVQFTGKYRSLAIAVAVAKRIGGVETSPDMDPVSTSVNEEGGDRDTDGNYQPGFWTDESLESVKTAQEKDLIDDIAYYMKASHVSALALYQSKTLQGQLVAFLKDRNVDPSLIAETKQSVEFGERLKNAMVLLGQRPGSRGKKPDTASWLRYLVSIFESNPGSTPALDGKRMSWPLFPLDRAPWPLLMPLARPVPLGEARYIWETFQGQHGSDRFHTYGPFRGDADAMPYELQPSPWFWDAWPDRILHGGECVSISKGTVDLYSSLARPAVWAGQPGHANLISFGVDRGAWTADVEQAFAGGPDATFAQWYFDDRPGTQLRFRDLYNWAGAEYHLGLALGMNRGLRSYMDTRIAANIFNALPSKDKQNLGGKLLGHVLETNPFNPDIWYRLAQLMPDTKSGMALVEAVMRNPPDAIGYWTTVEEFVARFSILDQPLPQNETELKRISAFLRNVPGIGSDDLESYAARYYQNLADQGDAYGQLQIAVRYQDGAGVPRDRRKAGDYFARSAAQGNKEASRGLELLDDTIPGELINVTASSQFSQDQSVRNLVDDAGMRRGLHDNDGSARTMWQSIENPIPEPPDRGLDPSPAWVRFDFQEPENLRSIMIWNHNQTNLTDRGFRKTRIYGSRDGAVWFSITSPEIIDLPRAGGADGLAAVTIANAAARSAIKSLIVAAASEEGNYGSDCFGLSAVHFIVYPKVPYIPAEMISVTPSSQYGSDQAARHLVDGAGMWFDHHDNDGSARTMWHSVENPALQPPSEGLQPSPAWVRFDFAGPQKLDAILIWNHNQANLTDRGFRKTRIYGSSDGATWFPLTLSQSIELPRASGNPGLAAVAIAITDTGRPVKAVIIAAEAVEGNYGSNIFGLSAVRFIASPRVTGGASP